MRLEAVACTDVGLRRVANEDSFAIARGVGLCVVADGMGGHRAGRVASQLATDHAVSAIEALTGSQLCATEKLRHAVADANAGIRSRSQDDPDLSGMGTTFVALLASEQRVALAHVGDSRVYLIRGGQIRPLTEDHSVVGELLRGRKISEDDARAHPHRHVLTRALGAGSAAEPDLAELTPSPGDTFVLCSDGLTTHLRDDEIREIVARGDSLQKRCDRLIAAANRRGGLDNITALLVQVESC
jgi:serine/threonine protein phosphatase PrpC